MSESHLEERSLLDLVSFIVDNRGRSCPVAPTGFPLIATNCVTDGSRRAIMKDVRYVNSETYDTWFRAHPRPNDVLFVCKGSPGKVALVPEPAPYCIAQDMVALRANPDEVDAEYLYYRLSAPDVRERIEGLHVGTLIPHFKKGDFGKLRFSVHPVPEQRRIASVLGALDDLIEANNTQADLLASLAQAAGGSFVMRLRYRGTTRLSDVCTVTRGFSYQSAELVGGGDTLVNLKNIGRGGRFQPDGLKPLTSDRFKASQIVEPGDVVVSMTDLTQQREVVGRPVRVPDVAAVAGRMVASLDLAIVRPTHGYTRELLVAALAQEEFHEHALGYCNGTTVLHMSARAFDDYVVPRAAPDEAAKIARTLGPLNAQEDAYRAEAQQLARTRHALLPLLMSGKVRVADVDAA